MNFDWDDINLEPGWHENFREVREVLNAALKHALQKRELKRGRIAEIMTEILDVQITENVINKWTRSDGNGHKFPLKYARVFAQVTGDPRILLWHAASCGLRILLPREEKKFKVYLLWQQEQKLRREREKIQEELSE